jgi:hypothetical protein
MFTTFSIAGSLYLMGVGFVLFIKPSYMFTPDGDWKEFGIGQREERYTPFPFWLFCLTWAIVVYVIVVLLEPSIFGKPRPLNAAAATAGVAYNAMNRRPVANNYADSDSDGAVELPKGYYVLNKKATRLSGVPKYVYLGPQEPQD